VNIQTDFASEEYIKVTRGAIDCDGHILEPPDLWETYLEPKYRDRAIKIVTNDEGYECLQYDGQLSKLSPPGFVGILGAMGNPDHSPSPTRKYVAGAPFGSMDPKQRLQLMDREGIAKSILYPTLGILWEAEVKDPELSAAYSRAYNRWIVDFCADSGGRLVPIAHISLGDPDMAAEELKRAVEAGCKGGFIVPFTWSGIAPGESYYDRLWATAEELGVPMAVHPAFEPTKFGVVQRFGGDLAPSEPINFGWYFDLFVVQGVIQAFATFFQYGTFDRFPKLKMVVLESQAGWLGYLLDRMDAIYKSPLSKTTQMTELPSTYFRRQCWISADPDERALAHIIDYVGSDRFFWASDFPHPDHTGDYMPALANLVSPLSQQTRENLLYRNVASVYGLDL
jgi:predicted TIM-barrel fold metal-dependent hydrolase